MVLGGTSNSLPKHSVAVSAPNNTTKYINQVRIIGDQVSQTITFKVYCIKFNLQEALPMGKDAHELEE